MDSQKALFGAGCFWGVQYYFDQVPGVTKTVAGYSGGTVDHPTYEAVCSHTTGHAEVVEVSFNPKETSYETLVRHFFRIHNPTELNKQGPDIGDSYRSVVFYFDEAQKATALAVKADVQTTIDKPIVTAIEPAKAFWPAEDYHQKFAERTGRGMCHIPYQQV